ncbi:hypothetical protein GXM_10256 [Nostoc sphaeroides CCNUC1]|uniref:Uncharacterized protein n=1 Tax=Nostoc sphaeroides CCNUC1 TaxID=2653204 RepID=A0A5P8WKK7_9NOSO|nr:hypothetical protein GXM_10256 [Nostoc sphaeroides CCNUC1]
MQMSQKMNGVKNQISGNWAANWNPYSFGNVGTAALTGV